MSTITESKRWERRKDARPQELLASALELFVERGYAATKLDDVAARAGVSKGTLYLYFINKEELFKAVIRENMVPLIGEAENTVDSFEKSTEELFRAIIHGWWERVGNTPLSGITKLLISEASNFPEVLQFYHDEVISRGNALIIRMLERGIERKEFRNINTTAGMHLIAAPMLMMMLWKHSFHACEGVSFSPESYLDTFIDVFLHGLLNKDAEKSGPSK